MWRHSRVSVFALAQYRFILDQVLVRKHAIEETWLPPRLDGRWSHTVGIGYFFFEQKLQRRL